jgi:hypothetical protein
VKCEECEFWTIRRETHYGDGTVKQTWIALAGKGQCDKLNQQTEYDFGCTKFSRSEGDHIDVTKKPGEPWQHWKMGPCPTCQSRGSHNVELRPACDRCAGTAQVRFYEDGFVGDERTRRHPNETPKPLVCPGCKKEVSKDWKHCPWCQFHLPIEEKESDGGAAEGAILPPPPPPAEPVEDAA